MLLLSLFFAFVLSLCLSPHLPLYSLSCYPSHPTHSLILPALPSDVPLQVVEKDKLRPAYGHQPAKFDKKSFAIPPEIQRDISLTADALPRMVSPHEMQFDIRRFPKKGLSPLCTNLHASGSTNPLSQAKNAGLFALNLTADGTELMALGSAFALETAYALVNMHFVKAPQLSKVGQRASSLQSRMSDASGTLAKGKSVTFETPSSLVGHMIGPKVKKHPRPPKIAY